MISQTPDGKWDLLHSIILIKPVMKLQTWTKIKKQTLIRRSALNSKCNPTQNLYDRLVVKDVQATRELVNSAVVIDVRDVAVTPKAIYQAVSDNLQIMSQFRTGPDDD